MKWLCRSFLTVAVLLFTETGAFAESTWTTLTEPAEIQQLFSNQATRMYKRYEQYYRADGVMAEYDPPTDWYTLRHWTVREDGRLCWAIFTKPDHEIDCAAIQTDESGSYRYKWDNSNTGPPLDFVETVQPGLLEMLDEKAGPLD